jgi:hypothetical protein
MSKNNKKVSKKTKDRSWIRPPNSITKQTTVKVKKNDKNFPSSISYWVDENGEARLYTKEQLAQCNILMSLNLTLSKAFVLIENIQKLDKDTTIGSLMSQDFAQFKEYEVSPYSNFIELISAVHDITFAEFLGFISQETSPESYSKLGKAKLAEAIKNIDPDNTNFFSSDKLEKS